MLYVSQIRKRTSSRKKAVPTEAGHHDHPHTVTGVVVEENEKGDLKPIVGANLHWANLPSRNTRSNENGVFKLEHKEGFNKLVVSYVGMKSDTITIKDLHEVVMITAKGNVLMEVEVKGTRKSTYIDRMTPARLEVLTGKNYLKRPAVI
ncbi:carboxypeptidase-like regulatory domain-containing protein [Sphingobacterium sp. E70]|uniref:carboxypeptidase-like regulatory domain-containing protein n=1 Tax=Sphingobacterium sp. E70 TaxID=2853439 RepID=UPI00211C9E27|nr:carboxypeptidase-like regulatory domain-containing protein [Sphingobacterium sp. E70]ULT27505.1 carboxypeptidase-like regulatory domain-containing protein [Sphingobacterium sp. E70]